MINFGPFTFSTHFWSLANLQRWRQAGAISLVGLGLGLSGFGLMKITQASQVPVCVSAVDELQISPPVLIEVDVAGQVKRPGRYQLAADSRVGDALDQAGGFTDQVDLSYVAQQLNLAAQLADQDKIYLPAADEKTSATQSEATATSVTGGGSLPTETSAISNSVASGEPLVSVNQATQSELEELPDIGAKRAQQIIAGRPYQNLGELVTKEILTTSLWEKVKDRLTL